MTAVDTNILVRFLTRDDPRQFAASRAIFESEAVFVPDTVILETEWVLRFAYDFSAEEICGAFRKLFGLPNVSVANAFVIAQAISWHEQGLDFPDALHLALCQKQPVLKTFDEKFIKRAKGLSSCEVVAPKLG